GSLLGSLAAGVNFPHLACQAALGGDVVPGEPHYCEYATGRESIRWFLERPHRLLRTRTALRYVLTDPLPALAGGFSTLRPLGDPSPEAGTTEDPRIAPPR